MTFPTSARTVVLIVDDNTTNLRVLSAYLEAEGFSVRVAQDGESAIEAAISQIPDLILLDILMPGIDGFETCRRLKNNPLTREIPTIFMSALSEPVDKVTGLSLGAVDYITKPFQREEVLARIRLHLKMRRLTQTLAAQNRRLQDEIRNRRHAEGVSRAKSQFLAKMSHELRTPLNAILGFSQLLDRDAGLSAEQREHLQVICRSGEHLLTLINDILELSKIEAGKATLRESAFELSGFLEDVQDMLELRSRSKGLSLRDYCADNVPAYVLADAGKLRQVLINLLSNAIKFTDRGSVVLRVGATPQTGDRLRLYFEVEDTGVGIPPEALERIFEPFVQSQIGYRDAEGTGLGLPIARQLVELMGGQITMSSTEGVGTLVKFDIPVAVASAAEVAVVRQVRQVASKRPVALASTSSPKILVVDDRPESRQFLVKLLEITGFQVREARDGREAVQVWQEWQPDLIWMDVRMPGMDGYEATRRIKAAQAASGSVSPKAIVALTASAFEEDRTSVLQAGWDDFIRKPFQESEIFDTLARHLGVEYVYESAPKAIATASPQDLPEPTLTDFQQIPRELLSQLHLGAMSADEKSVRACIEKLSPLQPQLTQALLIWVDDFRFDRLFELAGQALEAVPADD